MSPVKLAPSILSADFARLGQEIESVEEAGADWIHVDVMDGHFVPNITIGPLVVEAARRVTELPLDVHLMIQEPDRYLEAFAEAGADRLTVHQEACPHLHRTLQGIRDLGLGAGVAVNPATPVSLLTEVADQVDLILIMSVNPGFGGQSYIPSSTGRVREASALVRESGGEGVEIQVDGGVTASNAGELAEAGATVLVAGSAVFRHPEGGAAGVAALRRALDREAPADGGQ